jgi:hypothetical protein
VETELVDFYYRSWCFLRSGTRKDSTSLAGGPFPDFCQQLQNSALGDRLSDEKLSGEFLIVLSYNKFDILNFILTNRRIIHYESTGAAEDRNAYQRKVYGLNRIESCEYGAGSGFWAAMLLTFKDGSKKELKVSGGESLQSDLQFALERGGHDWSHLWEGGDDYRAELNTHLESEKGKAAQATFEREKSDKARVGAILGPIMGISAALLFMSLNGAPLAEGGPAMIRWISQDGNFIIVGGAVLLGWAAPSFMRL